MKLNKLIVLARAGYNLLIKIASSLQSPLLLVVRLYWGWQFFQTGLGKFQNLDRTTAFFRDDLHIPLPAFNATLVGTTECVGGLLLLVGLASRLAAIPLIVTLIVAYLTDGIETVKNIFNDPDKFLSADPFHFLFASVLIFVFGPGAFSIDRLIGRKLNAVADRATQEQEPAKPVVHDSARVIAS